MAKKKYSILGDSISTFEGYTPAVAVFFDRIMVGETGIADVKDTWWMQVIEAMDGELGYNNSMAGCLVAGDIASSGTNPARIRSLACQGSPDVILIMMGCNDWAFGVHPKEFEEGYRLMVQRIRQEYPQAEIWCSTLPEGREVDPIQQFFYNIDGRISGKVYSDVIRRIADQEGCSLADLAACPPYDTIDGVHPNRQGMKMLADYWIAALSD